MIRFELFLEDPRRADIVMIDPSQVASVQETEKRRMDSAWQNVAIVTMANGEKFTVLDPTRSVSQLIAKAKDARPPRAMEYLG